MYPIIMGKSSYRYHKKVSKLFVGDVIGYWPLDEGPAGQDYLTFNGTTTNVDCGSGASLDDLHDAEFTVDMWIKADADAGNNTTMIGKRSGSAGWFFYLSSGRPTVLIYCATTNATATANVTSILDGAWHHVTLYFNDAGDRKPYIALDGTWVSYASQVAGVGAIVSDAAANLTIGSASSKWDGSIGWTRIANNDKLGVGVDFTAPSRTVIPTVDANTVSLWPMDEGYGTVAGDIGTNDNDGTITDGDWGTYPATNDISPENNDGVYTGATLGSTAQPPKIGGFAPLFDGVNDFSNVHSAGLASDFSPTAGSIFMWMKVNDAGVWTDGVSRYGIRIYRNSDEDVKILRGANNELATHYRAGGVNEIVTKSGMTTTDWFLATVTWTDPGNVSFYIDGVSAATPQAIENSWTGSDPIIHVIGAGNTSALSPWRGYLAHVILLNRVATTTEIANVYNWGAS